MTFEAIYMADDETDDGYRKFEAVDLQDAKKVLRSLVVGRYVLHNLTETAGSSAARKAA